MAQETVNIKVLIEASKSAKTIDELEKSVEDLNKELDKVDKGSKEFKTLEKAISKAEKQMVDFALATDQTSATVGELERNIEILTEELKGVDRGSQEFEILRQKLVDTTRELKNVELSLEALDTDQVAGEIGGLVGGIGDVTSAFVLLGGEGNETMEQIGQRLEAGIGIAIGFKGAIEGIQSGIKLWRQFGQQIKNNNALLKITALAQGALNAVTGIFATITGAGTTALKLFRIALISTGIGALVVGVGLLIANFDKLLGLFTPIIDGLKAIGDWLGITNFATEEKLELINKEVEALKKQEAQLRKNLELETRYAENRIANLEIDKTLAKSAEDQIAIEDKLLKEKLDNLEREREAFRSTQRDQLAELEAKVKRFKVLRDDEADDLFVNQEFINQQNAKIRDQEKINADFRKQIAEDNFQALAEIDTKERALRVASQKEKDKILADDKKREADERKRRNDAFRSRQKELLDNERQIEDLRLALLDDGLAKEELLIQTRYRRQREDALANTKLTADQRKALIIELQNTEDAEIKKLREKNDEEIKALEEQFFQDSLVLEEDRRARQLTLEFQANEERIRKLAQDDETLTKLLSANREKFLKDLDAIESEYAKLDDQRRQELKDKTIADANELAILEVQAEINKLDELELIGEEGLKLQDRLGELQIKQIEDQTDAELRALKAQFEEQKKLYEEQGKDLSELTEQYATERALIEKQGAEAIAEIDRQTGATREEQAEAVKEALVDLAFETAQLIADTSFEIAQENADREAEARVGAIESAFNQETELLNAKVEQGLITQREADRKAKELERKKNKDLQAEAKKKFEEDKRRQTAQAIVNGALAFTNAVATTQPAVPLGLIAGAGVLIATGAQIAKIQSTQFAKGGILQGPSHARGGIKTQFGELEGGEAVINKRSTSMFKGTLSRINQAGGGVKFAQGGILGGDTPGGGIGSSGDLSNILERLNQNLEKPQRSYVVESDITETQNRVKDLEQNAEI